MTSSTDRIITTHAGSLPRPPELLKLVRAKVEGQPLYGALSVKCFFAACHFWCRIFFALCSVSLFDLRVVSPSRPAFAR